MHYPRQQIIIRVFMLATILMASTLSFNSVLCVNGLGHSQIELPHSECCTGEENATFHAPSEYDNEVVSDCGSCDDFFLHLIGTVRPLSQKQEGQSYTWLPAATVSPAHGHDNRQFVALTSSLFIAPHNSILSTLSTTIIRC